MTLVDILTTAQRFAANRNNHSAELCDWLIALFKGRAGPLRVMTLRGKRVVEVKGPSRFMLPAEARAYATALLHAADEAEALP